MRERIVDEFIRLAKIDAPSYKEREMAEVLKGYLSEMGIDSQEDDTASITGSNCGNLYAVWEGDPSLPPILLSAHMDTVQPAYKKQPVVKGDRIVSDGDTVLGADDLAGVVEILEGIRRVKESGRSHRTVELLFTVAEEVYTKGAAAVDYSRLRSKEAYCFDLSGDVGIAARRAPSLIAFQIEVTGKASHAGFAPQDGINAILVVAQAIASVRQGQVDSKSTVNIGTISGGIATNIVSDYCRVSGEIRSYDHEKAMEYLKQIEESFAEVAHSSGAKARISHEIHFQAYEVEEEDHVVRNFEKAVRNIGIESKIISTLGGADNNQFYANGIKGLVVSCGMENVHTTDEFIKIENLLNGAKLVEQLITY